MFRLDIMRQQGLWEAAESMSVINPVTMTSNVLKKLVLPDGSVLQARYPGRPTRDCLFVDPTGDNKSLLKIWNMNACTGVVRVFNCQEAGWSDEEKCIKAYEMNPEYVTGCVGPMDVELLEDVAKEGWNGDCVVYAHNSGKLTKLKKMGSVTASLKFLEYEVYTISPIMDYNSNIEFAPLGLIEMYNAGGAVESIDYFEDNNISSIKISVRCCGRFGAYTSKRPRRWLVDSLEAQYSYERETCLLTVIIPASLRLQKMKNLELVVEF